jgi:hypothetical protein
MGLKLLHHYLVESSGIYSYEERFWFSLIQLAILL